MTTRFVQPPGATTLADTRRLVAEAERLFGWLGEQAPIQALAPHGYELLAVLRNTETEQQLSSLVVTTLALQMRARVDLAGATAEAQTTALFMHTTALANLIAELPERLQEAALADVAAHLRVARRMPRPGR